MPPSATCWLIPPGARTSTTSARPSRWSAGCAPCARRSRGRASIDFDEEFGEEDRLTQAVTLFALLELYRKGEATWEQSKPFGPIQIRKKEAAPNE